MQEAKQLIKTSRKTVRSTTWASRKGEATAGPHKQQIKRTHNSQAFKVPEAADGVWYRACESITPKIPGFGS